jgi:hypothetical protein
MDGRGEPRNQPIGMLATIARLIDEGLAVTREQYATLLEARPKPWGLDDALVAGAADGEYVCALSREPLAKVRAGFG